MTEGAPSIMWFTDDLRLADNAALTAAAAAGPLIALYVLDEDSSGARPPGGDPAGCRAGSLGSSGME